MSLDCFPTYLRDEKRIMDGFSCGTTMYMTLSFLSGHQGGRITSTDPTPFYQDAISSELARRGYIGVCLENGAPEDVDHHTFAHCFVLWRHKETVYRIESYVGTYPCRLVQFDDYQDVLSKLVNLSPEEDRLKMWNSLFSSEEPHDSKRHMYMSLVSCD